MMMMVLMVGDDNCIVYSVHGMLQIWLHNTLPRFHSLKTNCVLFTRLFVVLFFCYYMVCLTLACGYCNGLLFWAIEHFRVHQNENTYIKPTTHIWDSNQSARQQKCSGRGWLVQRAALIGSARRKGAGPERK